MEGVPGDLLEYLIDEIALNGDLGCTPQDIRAFAETFIQRHKSQHRKSLPKEIFGSLPLHPRTLNELWQRLKNHPGIRPWKQSDQPTVAGTHVTLPAELGQVDVNSASGSLDNDRIQATQVRSYAVICGSLPEKNDRFSAFEFHLLSLVAASRQDGLSSADLARATGEPEGVADTFLTRFQAFDFITQRVPLLRDEGKRWILSRFKASLRNSNHGEAEGQKLNENGTRMDQHHNQQQNQSATSAVSHQQQDSAGSDVHTPHRDKENVQVEDVGVDDADDSAVSAPFISAPHTLVSTNDTSNMAVDWETGHSRFSNPERVWSPDPNDAVSSNRKTKGGRKPKFKPHGRPRKFVKGTELFWRDQFLNVKQGLAPESVGQDIFAQRPENFDEILVRAIASRLPQPALPQDISQQWIEKTLSILERSEDGLYLSLPGEKETGRRKKLASQLLIFRSPRLRELDLSDDHVVALVRFLTSSAAHTFHYRRYYPKMSSRPPSYIRYDEIDKPVKTQENAGDSLEPVVHPSASEVAFQYYPSSPGLVRTLMSTFSLPDASGFKRKNPEPETSPTKRRVRRKLAKSEVEVAPNPSKPINSSIYMPEATELSSSPNPYGLPPPLMTRGARRKQEGVQQQQQSPSIVYSSSRSFIQPALAQNLVFSIQNPESYRWDLVLPQVVAPAPTFSGFWKPSDQVYIPQADDEIEERFQEASDSEYEEKIAVPRQKVQFGGRGGKTGKLRRNIVLEIVQSCSGVVPYNSVCPGDALLRRWEEEGLTDPIDAKTLKMAVKSLCNSGKLKQINFSFRSKKGLMVTKTILANPSFHATHPLVVRLQKEVMEADPQDYIPPELDLDGSGEVRRLADRNPELSSFHKRHGATVLTLRFNSSPGRRSYRNVVIAARSRRRDRKRVIWKQDSTHQILPGTLEEILRDEKGPVIDHTSERDPAWSKFDWEVEAVKMWEHRTLNYYQDDNSFSGFINHVLEDQESPGYEQEWPLRMTPLMWFDVYGNQAPYPFSQTPLPDLYNDPENGHESMDDVAPQPKKRRLNPPSSTPITDRYAPGVSKRPKQPYNKQVKQTFLGTHTPARKYGTKNDRKPAPSFVVDEHGHIVDGARTDSIIPIKRPRGAQHLRNMSDHDVSFIAVAVTVVRTLVGGIEKYIDWPIVMLMFPNEEEQFIKDRWRTLSNRYRRDVSGLTESFQEKYLLAYERGEVPGINYEDLEDNDWDAIVSWAYGELSTEGKSGVEELPSSEDRERWMSKKDFEFREFKGMRELSMYNSNATNPRKEEAMVGSVFATPLLTNTAVQIKFAAEEEQRNDFQLARARSWVFATIMTKADHYDDHDIRMKLLKLAPRRAQVEELVDRALKVLQRDRVIARNRSLNRDAGVMGGGWEASVKFFEHFRNKRLIHWEILKKAAMFKMRTLDPYLSRERRIVIGKTALVEDGDMVALLNLSAAGQLKLSAGDDAPSSRYGLDWENHGYQTRLLDKNVLSFSVVAEKTEDYVFGDPMAGRRLQFPRGEIDDVETGRIPMWFDILGNFQPDIWEMVIAAVVGLVSVRAGIGNIEMARSLGHCITAWELDLICAWAEASGFIQKTGGSGWITEEWWWLVLGADSHRVA